jgi:hypothetical protein
MLIPTETPRGRDILPSAATLIADTYSAAFQRGQDDKTDEGAIDASDSMTESMLPARLSAHMTIRMDILSIVAVATNGQKSSVILAVMVVMRFFEECRMGL